MDLYEEATFLYHYYERNTGPLINLSELDIDDAEKILKKLQKENNTFAAKRPENYLIIRRELEQKIRELFIKKGGEPKKGFPHYFILGECAWVKEWFQNGMEVKIPIKSFNSKSISFTYGDSIPAMRFQDGKPYRGQVYTLEEISKIIKLYGFPQEWNKDGKYGPERYIEVQVWDDEPLNLCK
ncbi:hypothetical protein [Gracilibacillus dipsosauri]|uniref:Uncharacterized protein n=1 Tax=Gracilibacillus dipsosauri TaxID=178340 RepID=A0A317L353_9BACI|nr:hypothetical protein [Gracilibacillus dipsosauri]PWU69430.1 hypothetical protein DLJ74_05495 [Gracilibacillus dipsosauri]